MLRALVGTRTDRSPRRVAVVGNAPVDPSADRAERIDSADLVVRMTTFAVDDGTPCIGRRTDVVVLHRATTTGPGTFAEYRRRVYLLAEPGRLFYETEAVPVWWPADLAIVPISNREFTRPLRKALGFGGLNVAWPTTGTLAVHLMRRLFPHAQIDFAGTTVDEPDAGADGRFAHHWGEPVTLTPEHDLDAERRLLDRWRRAGWLAVLP